ncbi:MAG TPA: hypothetical protein VMT73_12440 [Anaerolineales bacterium]|nr:hypothetical protein [Anaerolineales bacterium]
MLNIIIAIFVGWPAIMATIILAGIGLFRRDYRFIVAGAILAVPFSWFLSGFPIIHSLVFLLPVLLLASAFALYRDHEMIAWLIAVPYFLTILFLYYTIVA